MTNENLPDYLSKRLNETLPGMAAHQLLKAKRPSGDTINFIDRPDKRMGGVMIVFYYKDDNWHFPVIKRPQYDGTHGGQISLPGGKVEPGDQDLIATAKRETREEIGIPENDVHVLGTLSSFYVGASNYEVLPVVSKVDYIPNFIPDPAEVDDVIEIPLSDLLDNQNLKEKEIEVRGYRLIAPYFDIKSQFIWGATAMILNELLTIIREYE